MLLRGLLTIVTAAASFASVTSQRIQRSGYRLKEEVGTPTGWTAHPIDFSKSSPIQLRIGLKQQNVEEAESLLAKISDPSHERYGKHLTAAEVRSMLAPSRQTIETVLGWLESHDVPSQAIRQHNDFIHCSVPLYKAEQMLNTEYHAYRHKVDDKQVIRARSYSLPIHLHDHIDLIQPTTMFGNLHMYRANVLSMDNVEWSQKEVYRPRQYNSNVTVSFLNDLYNIGNYTSQNASTSIAFASFLEQYANFEDYSDFISTFAQEQDDGFNVTLINGGMNSQNLSLAGGEANLDTYAFALAGSRARKTVFATGGRPPVDFDLVLNGTNSNEPYLDFLDYVLAENYTSTHTLPGVLSVSYGEDEQSVPYSYAKRVCDGFMQLTLMGTSVIFASGDTGVGPGGNETDAQCKSNIPGRTNETTFLAAFPPTCPFVTAVGGTVGFDPEVAVEVMGSRTSTQGGFYSGGGFSRYFPQPSYQRNAVSTYLTTAPYNLTAFDAALDLFDPRGRAYPDVSAQSLNFFTYVSGRLVRASGTSAAAPAFAGIVALLNDARAGAGLPLLGFLNPLLYSLASIAATATARNQSEAVEVMGQRSSESGQSETASSPGPVRGPDIATLVSTLARDRARRARTQASPLRSSIRSSTSASISGQPSGAESEAKGAAPLTDITIGTNPGCGTNGFPAAPGWDPVTGLGTPNFRALRDTVLLPHLINTTGSEP